MPESADSLLPLEAFRSRELPAELLELVEEVVGVGRRLNHNVLGPEHLMVVGAEHGVQEMARMVPSLSSFREALLDALYDDRDAFRYEPEGGDDDSVWLQHPLVAALERIAQGEEPQEVMTGMMLSEAPRIARAVAYARGNEPDVVPPDTLTLERHLHGGDPGSLDDSVAGEAAPAAAPQAPEPNHDAPPAQAPSAAQEVPLTSNLGEEAADDPPLVGRDAVADQVARILLRFHQPAVLVTGPAGSGKTAFVRGLAARAASGALPSLAGFTFYRLRLLDLVSQSHRGQDLHNLMDQILSVIEENPQGVLVVDDLHLLVAKQGYPLMSDLIDTIKLHISKGTLRALLTVDAATYAKAFSNDSFFTSQITTKRLAPLERDELLEVARVYRGRLEQHFDLSIEDGALEAAVVAALADESPEYHPPGAIIRLLDEACAMARASLDASVSDRHVHACHNEESEARSHHDRRQLREIEARLSERVLGQDLAAAVVGRRVRLAKLHLDRKPERPDGVFLFMGPSGVGKTEMARGLARALYDDESRLVRLDMSEYMEPHSVARIIGAPPGYVGYGEDGALTGPVADLGHCVVLLDEIEKAHPRVLNLFLQVFDDGRLTDSKGRLVDFSDTVIIMTSNIGRELYAIHGSAPIGFAGKKENDSDKGDDHPVRDVVQDHLLRVLPSEFVNRIDEIVPFRVLEEDDIVQIAVHLLDMEVERWRERGKAVSYGPEVPRVIALTGYDPRLGARHVERNLERLVISVMSDAAVSDSFEQVREMSLVVDEGSICLRLDGEPFTCLNPRGTTHPEGGQG